MTGFPALDWAVLAVSFFNTIQLLWLGLTVVLNAEQNPAGGRGRRFGPWMAGAGLFLGGVFFVCHTAILGIYTEGLSPWVEVWWRVGWVALLALPFAWYALMLWYAGYWEDAHSALARRHRLPLAGAAILAAGGILLLIALNPLPSFSELTRLPPQIVSGLLSPSPFLLFFPAYILLCNGLAFDALLRPGPTARLMGNLARRRARPWLMASSGSLVGVCLMVAGAIVWVLAGVGRGAVSAANATLVVSIVDLVISLLIGAAVVLLGQAISAYEVFTGKAMPRHGLARYWRNALILAAGFSLVIAWSLTAQILPIYALLLATLLMTVFYSLLTWRSYAERERFIGNLRPFVSTERLVDRLVAQTAAPLPEMDAAGPFRALCAEVLGAGRAALIATGPLAPLWGAPLTYPDPFPVDTPPPAALGESSRAAAIPIEPAAYAGLCWAVPLWSERGLIGTLLLGEKADGGLYAQEEIEIAQTAGERLIDAHAGGELARRLMALQRERLAASQVADRRARRTLHDEILPELHGAILSLSAESGAPARQAVARLTAAHRRISNLLREMPSPAAPEVTPAGLAAALRHMTEDELQDAFDGVTWEIAAGAEAAAAALPPLAAEVLFYAAREAARNAARHGRGTESSRPLHLRCSLSAEGGMTLTVEDDGVGIRPADYPPGHGLSLHSTMMAVVGGTLSVESAPGRFTRIRLTLPQTGG